MPRCTPQEMLKVIRRNMPMKNLKPEHNLILAIIGCALVDLLEPGYRWNTVRFFNHEMFDIYCNLLELNPVTTKQLLVQGDFLYE